MYSQRYLPFFNGRDQAMIIGLFVLAEKKAGAADTGIGRDKKRIHIPPSDGETR